MSIKLRKSNLERDDIFIALWPAVAKSIPDRLSGCYNFEDYPWLTSHPQHIILGIIRKGIFHNVEE